MPVGRRLMAVVAVAAVVLLGVLPACGRSGSDVGPEPRADAGMAKVTRVIDGDTIQVQLGPSGQKVRLIGIDTPETRGPGALRDCFGAEATSRVQALLPAGTTVRLVRDAEPRDRYGRLLAYVYRCPTACS